MTSYPVPLRSGKGAYRIQGSPLVVNAYAEVAGGDQRAESVLVACPGLATFGSAVSGPCRAMLSLLDSDRLYTVNGFYLFEILSDGTKTNKGLVPGTGRIWMARNDRPIPQIVIVGEQQVKVLEANKNLVLRSETLQNAYWTKTNLTYDDVYIAPDGEDTAPWYYETTTNGEHVITSTAISIERKKVYTASAYVANDTVYAYNRDYAYLRVTFGSSAQVGVVINKLTGEVTTAVGEPLNATAVLDQNSFWRVSFVFNSKTNTTCQIEVGYLAGSTYTPAYAGNVLYGSYTWGFQLEPGDTVSDYLPTTSAQVERDLEGRTYFNDLQPEGVEHIGGYFVFWRADGRIYVSELLSTEVDPLSFATAESSPDGITFCKALGKILYIVGPDTTELWTLSSGGAFPLIPLASATLEIGSQAAGTVASLGDGFAFVSRDSQVYLVKGGGYSVISTPYVSRLIEDTDHDELSAFTWSRGGNEFYTLQGDGWTVEYNETTGLWHTRESLGEQWIAGNAKEAFGQTIVGNRVSGAYYTLEPDIFTEAGDEMLWGFDTPVIHSAPNGLEFERIDLVTETGDGISGSTPGYLMLQWSDDNARSWKGNRQISLGKTGEYNRTVTARDLGPTGPKGRMFRVRISDAVTRSIIEMNIEARAVRLA